MSLISPNFAVKTIIFPNFGQGLFPKIAGISPEFIKIINMVENEVTCCLAANKSDIKANLAGFSSYKNLMLNEHSPTFSYYHVSEYSFFLFNCSQCYI